MKKEETREYLKDLYDSIKEINKSILDFKIAIHNLDKLGYNVEEIKKLLKEIENDITEWKNLQSLTNFRNYRSRFL